MGRMVGVEGSIPITVRRIYSRSWKVVKDKKLSKNGNVSIFDVTFKDSTAEIWLKSIFYFVVVTKENRKTLDLMYAIVLKKILPKNEWLVKMK